MSSSPMTRMSRPEGSGPHLRHGRSLVPIFLTIGLLAIAAGLLVPKFAPEREIPPAFQEVGPGKIEGDRCVSEFFGLSIRIPQGWQPMSREELERFLAQRDESDRQHMCIILFAARPFKPGPGVVEPTLSIAARRLSGMPEVKTVEDFVLRAQRYRERHNMNSGDPGKPYEAILGGQPCLRLDAKQRYETGVADTAMYSLLKRGYGLSIMAACQTPEDQRALMDSLATVRFE